MRFVVLSDSTATRHQICEALDFNAFEITFVTNSVEEPLSSWYDQKILLIADLQHPEALRTVIGFCRRNKNSLVLSILSRNRQDHELNVIRTLGHPVYVPYLFNRIELRTFVKRMVVKMEAGS